MGLTVGTICEIIARSTNIVAEFNKLLIEPKILYNYYPKKLFISERPMY